MQASEIGYLIVGLFFLIGLPAIGIICDIIDRKTKSNTERPSEIAIREKKRELWENWREGNDLVPPGARPFGPPRD